MPKRIECRGMGPADAQIYQTLRLEGFRLEPRGFRYTPEDEANLPLADVEARLRRDHVVGAFAENALVGVGGLAFSNGLKTEHKALLYGMYIRNAFRGAGVGDSIMEQLMHVARGRVEIVTLTVVSQNTRARGFYERWGFRAYGVEERAIKLTDRDYLDETLMALRMEM